MPAVPHSSQQWPTTDVPHTLNRESIVNAKPFNDKASKLDKNDVLKLFGSILFKYLDVYYKEFKEQFVFADLFNKVKQIIFSKVTIFGKHFNL